MSYQLVNETRLVVEQEINEFVSCLEDDHPFRMALSLPYFRNILIAKILNKIPNRHKLHSFKSKNTISIQPANGILKEHLYVEELIHSLMPEIINDQRSNRLVDQCLLSSSEEIKFHHTDPAWWVKIHTIIPCVTYYFGPFNTRKEAQNSYPGYLDDLKSEKAIGISGYFEFIKPNILTVTDSPGELKQDVQNLWRKLKENQGKLWASQQAIQNQWEILPGNYLLTGLDGKIKDANTRSLNLFGLSLGELQGKFIAFFAPQPQLFCLAEHIKIMYKDQTDWETPYCWSMQFQFPQKDLIAIDISVTQQKNAQGQVVGWYWLLHQVSFTEAESQQFYFDSRHDSLTLLPNRILLASLMGQLRQNCLNTPADLFAFLFIDINKFKSINDRFGHHIGDQVLKIVAHKLVSCVRDCDHVARIGGDEFLIVINKIQSAQDAKNCALRIHRAFTQPVTVAENEVICVEVSIGIVIGDGYCDDHNRLVHYADIAMYEAKSNNNSFVLVDSSQSFPDGNGNGNNHAQDAAFVINPMVE